VHTVACGGSEEAALSLRNPIPVLFAGLAALALVGCAATPRSIEPTALFDDAAFQPEAAVPAPANLMALDSAMQVYAEDHLRALATHEDPRRALIDALYRDHGLRLDYDATATRTAAEAFTERSGNCLSLVMMTAAFARHLGLPVTFQAVHVEELHSRNGDLHFASGHVNLVLGKPRFRGTFGVKEADGLVVDFVRQDELGSRRVQTLSEATIVAMYYNNRAAELLAAGDLRAAYWHVRAALRHQPGFATAENTLGVVYARAGDVAAAEIAYRQALEADPGSVGALGNLVHLLRGAGRLAEADALKARLDRLEPEPPFHHFQIGRAAAAAGDWPAAAEHFERELRLHPRQDEVHIWAARAWRELGDIKRARRHAAAAVEYSITPLRRRQYAAKLDQLRAAPRL
jgi:Tfp pilus assembly protein PilF